MTKLLFALLAITGMLAINACNRNAYEKPIDSDIIVHFEKLGNDYVLIAETEKDYPCANYPTMKNLVERENVMAMVAYLNEVPSGYILAMKINREESPFQMAHSYLLIDQIAVLEEHRHQGKGKELMRVCLETAVQNGYKEAQVQHWQLNSDAAGFFQSHGFESFLQSMRITM